MSEAIAMWIRVKGILLISYLNYKNFSKRGHSKSLGLMVILPGVRGSSVIQGTGTVEFEDGFRIDFSLEAAGPLAATAPRLGSITNPLGGAGWSWGRHGCHKDTPVRPNSNLLGSAHQLH